MKHTLIILLAVLLCLCSCQKEEDLSNTTTIVTPPQEEISTTQEDKKEFREQAVLGATLSRDFFSLLLSQSFSHPEIFGLQGNGQVETRTNCPQVSTSGTTLPISLTLDFGPAPGCTPPLFTQPKVGQIITTFNRHVFTSGEGDDFTIALSSDYREEGFFIKYDSGNPVVFRYNYDAEQLGYTMTFDEDLVMESVTTGKIIRIAARPDILNPFGNIGFIPDSGTVTDDPSDPFSYIDNICYLRIFDTQITFNNVTDYCLDISSDTGYGLEFQPFVCHCITKGALRVNENSDCSTANNNANADLIYDFGGGTCDGDIEITIDGVTTVENWFSCS